MARTKRRVARRNDAVLAPPSIYVGSNFARDVPRIQHEHAGKQPDPFSLHDDMQATIRIGFVS
jgi:hypothetical protein